MYKLQLFCSQLIADAKSTILKDLYTSTTCNILAMFVFVILKNMFLSFKLKKQMQIYVLTPVS